MNWLDFAIIAVIAWLTFSSFTTGIIREAINLIFGIVGVALAGIFYADLAEDVKIFTDDHNVASLVAFLLIFGAVAGAGQLAGVLLKNTAQLLMLGALDKLLGGFLGFAKALLLVSVVLVVGVTYPSVGLGEAIDGSAIAPYFLERIPVLLGLLPDEFSQAVDLF